MGRRSTDLEQAIDELEQRLIRAVISQQEHQGTNLESKSVCETCTKNKNKCDKMYKSSCSSSKQPTKLKGFCGLFRINRKRLMKSEENVKKSKGKERDKQKHSFILKKTKYTRQMIPCIASYKSPERSRYQHQIGKQALPQGNQKRRTNRNILNPQFKIKKRLVLDQQSRGDEIDRRQNYYFERIIPKDVTLLRASKKGASARSRGSKKRKGGSNKPRARRTNKGSDKAKRNVKKAPKPSQERKGWSSPLDKVKSKIPLIGGKSSTENDESNPTETESGTGSTPQNTGRLKGVFSKLPQVPKPSSVKQMLRIGNKEEGEEQSSKKEGGMSKLFGKANMLKSRFTGESSVSEPSTKTNTDSLSMDSTGTETSKSKFKSILKGTKLDKSRERRKGDDSKSKRKINIKEKAETLGKEDKSDVDSREANKTSKSRKKDLEPPKDGKQRSDPDELNEGINFRPIPDYIDLDKDFAIPDVDYCGISSLIQEDCATKKNGIKDALYDPLCLHQCDFMCSRKCRQASHCCHDCTPCKGDSAYFRQQPINVIVCQNPGPWMTPPVWPQDCHRCDHFSSLSCQPHINVSPDPCTDPISFYYYENCPCDYEPCFQGCGTSVDELDDVLDILNYS